jgi:hypothetical protein
MSWKFREAILDGGAIMSSHLDRIGSFLSALYNG